VTRGGGLEVVVAGLLLVGTLADAGGTAAAPPVLALSVVLCTLVALSGRAPVASGIAIGVLCTVLLLLAPEMDGPVAYACLAPVVTCGAGGRIVARRWFTGWAAALIIGGVLTDLPDDADTELVGHLLASRAVFVLVVVALAWAAGEAFRLIRRQHHEETDGTLRELRREIARDLHDGVAATVSAIALRAEQGLRCGGASVQDLTFIAERSREAIEELRDVLDLLRRTERDCTRFRMDRPRPLAEVIEQETAALDEAGFPVAVTIEGRIEVVPGPVADTLGRVLQQAAGNVRRHAAQGDCALLVDVAADRVELALINPVRSGAGSHHTPLGILGMHERVEAMGGTLEAGVVGTHWILRSTLPLRYAERRASR